MDDFEEIMKAVSDDGVAAARPVIKILTKMWQTARDELKEATARARRLRVVSIVAAVLSALCLFGCVYLGSGVHRQQGEIDALHRILEEGVVVEETTTTTETTTTVEQDIGECTLSETDKEMLRLHYIEEKDFRYIGDALGYTERTIKARHKRALKKLSDAL